MPLSATDLRPWIELEDLMLERTELAVLLVLLVATVPLWKGCSEEGRPPPRPCLEEDLSRRAEVRVW